MVQHATVAGLHGDGPEPGVLGERVGHLLVLVLDEAGGRHLEGRQVDDHVGLAKLGRPVGRVLAGVGEQRVRAGPARRPGLDPVHQGLRLVGRQALVVLEDADVRVGEIGRHAVRAHRLPDHRREAPDHLVAVHREGADAAVHVAGDALLLQDRRDLRGIGDVGEVGGVRPLGEGDRLARGSEGGAGDLRLVAGQQRVHSLVGASQRPAVGHGPGLRVDHEDLALALHAQLLAHQLLLVHQDRDAQAFLRGLGRDGVAAVGEVGVQRPDDDASVLVGVGQLLQLGVAGALVGRAVRPAHHHDRRRVAEVIEVLGQPRVIGELEVVDPLRGGGGRVGGDPGRGPQAGQGDARDNGGAGGQKGSFHGVCSRLFSSG